MSGLGYRSHHVLWFFFVFLCPLLYVHGATKSTQFIAPQLCNRESLNDAGLDKVFEN